MKGKISFRSSCDLRYALSNLFGLKYSSFCKLYQSLRNFYSYTNYGRISCTKGKGTLKFIFFFDILSVLYEICILNPLSYKQVLSTETWKAKLEFFLTSYWKIVEGSVEIPGPCGPYIIAWTSYKSIEHLLPTLIATAIG